MTDISTNGNIETPVVDLTAAPAKADPAPEKKEKTEAKPKKEKKVAKKTEKKAVKKEAKAKAPKAKTEKKTRKGNGRVAGTKAQTQVSVAAMNGIKKLAKTEDKRPADIVRKALYIGLKKLGIEVAEPVETK